MLRKALVLKLFESSYMQRWNDRLRPIELVEIDKQAHKMITAFVLGKFEENTPGFSWIRIIEGGIFELLQRIIITDIKPPVFYKIKADAEKYKKLNEWIFDSLEKFLEPLGKGFSERFRDYFTHENNDDINRKILGAAHIYASRWEFSLIERFNSGNYDIENIKKMLDTTLDNYSNLEGVKHLTQGTSFSKFLDICGALRFQYRWSNLHKTPKTSVLGHMYFVAVLSYIFSLEMDACPKRTENNFFTGLFHDLPEVLTRDIISPVKRSVEGLRELIQEYEKEEMRLEVYNLIPESWHHNIKLYTEDEFEDVVTINGHKAKISSEDINNRFNYNNFNPRDGKMIKAADELSAFIEAYDAINNGSHAPDFYKAKVLFSSKYTNTIIGGINFGQIYADFE